MKTGTKKLIVTIINIVIFVGNAIISTINGGDDMATTVSLATGFLTGTAFI